MLDLIFKKKKQQLKTSTFANSENQDKMQHYVKFHQGLHSLYR